MQNKNNSNTVIQDRYRKIFDDYYRYVYAIAFSKLKNCGSDEDAEDCVSEIFADLFVYLDNHEVDDSRIKSVISAVAGNKSVDMFRKVSLRQRRNISTEEYDIQEMVSAENTEEKIENRETGRTLLNLILSLGHPDSDIVMQKYYYNRKSREIAELTGLSPAAVRKRCSRAMKTLKELIKKSAVEL